MYLNGRTIWKNLCICVRFHVKYIVVGMMGKGHSIKNVQRAEKKLSQIYLRPQFHQEKPINFGDFSGIEKQMKKKDTAEELLSAFFCRSIIKYA